MNFYIQAGNPQIKKEYNSEDESLSDAIESVFPLHTESAIMMWNHIAIPLSYKYDISYMMLDILDLLDALEKEEKGEKVISWLPDTFRSDWSIVWEENQIVIKAHWESVVGNIDKLLNLNNKISLKKDEFIFEWKQILHIVICALKENGYTESKIKDIRRLESQLKSICGNEYLYQDKENLH